MESVRHVIYAHGFASSPASSKAQRFGRELTALGVGFSCPDLNEPSFETLTVTRMLDVVADEVARADAPVALVGSSLGAFVALHAADRDETGKIDRMVLLAPAFDFGGNRLRQLGEHGIDEWRRLGKLRVFHYADGQERDVGFALYEDAARYDAFAVTPRVPTLIFQGLNDKSVDPVMVGEWAGARLGGVHLLYMADDHQLTQSVDEIWNLSRDYFGLNAQARPV